MPLISFTRSAPIPRWNFRKADWERYEDLNNNLTNSLPAPRMDNINFAYKQFTQTLKTVAKQTIPRGFRKSYIPTWDEECSRLYKEYLSADSPDIIHSSASALTDLLDKKRHDRWIDTVSNIDFTHSSKKACKTVKRLTGTVSVKKVRPISPVDIGRQVVQNGLTESKDRKFGRQIIKELKTLQSCNTDNPNLHKQFTIEKVLRMVSISLNLGNLLAQTASIMNSWSTLVKML